MDVSFSFSSSAILLAEVSRKAAPFFAREGEESLLAFVTNSCFVAAIVVGIIIWIANKATSKMTLIPHPWQNFFESIIEAVYNQVEAIVGPKQAPRAFPLLATLFIFILVANYFGLLPGVGTVGWGHGHGSVNLEHIERPLLRPATADLNMTLGMALCFMLVWLYLTIRELGVWGFIKHTFGAKGGAKGFMGVFIAAVFLLVGTIEIVSIMFRPGSLSLRLYGNIYAGETLLHTMMTLGDMFGMGTIGKFILATIAPIPFYFMELLVGLLQASVFTLLCAVYIQLSTTHDDHHGEEHGHDHH